MITLRIYITVLYFPFCTGQSLPRFGPLMRELVDVRRGERPYVRIDSEDNKRTHEGIKKAKEAGGLLGG